MAHLIDRLPGYIELGNLNELGVCDVEFDVSAWLADYPLGVLNITYTRPGEDVVYPVDMTGVSVSAPLSGNLSLAVADEMYTLTWTISNAVTAIAGSGSVVVELEEGGTIVKRSRIIQTIVAEGHAAAGDPPDPLADYIDKWSAVDIAVTESVPGTPATGSITQDATGTHIALDLPTDLTADAGRYVAVPANETASGTIGDWAADIDYIYACYATDTWVRCAKTAW